MCSFDPSEQTWAAVCRPTVWLWVKACGPSEVNSPSQPQQQKHTAEFLNLKNWSVSISYSHFSETTLLGWHTHENVLSFKHAKTLPKAIFFTDVCLLISCTLTFPPSSCLPHSKAGLSHMSLITMCMNVYPTTKESAHGPQRGAGVCQIPAHAQLRLSSPLKHCLLQWTTPDLRGGEQWFWPKGRERRLSAAINIRAKTRVTTLSFVVTATSQTRGKVQQVFNVL